MKKVPTLWIFILFLSLQACRDDAISEKMMATNSADEIPFDHGKWITKEGNAYPYRSGMLNHVVYNDTIRSLNKDEILDFLGKPDREQDNHLYYLIERTSLGPWTLHTRTMVIKINPDNTVDWIKIHE